MKHVEYSTNTSEIFTPLQPKTILLKDGETVATLYPIPAYSDTDLLPSELYDFLLDEFNMEINKGDSFPYYESLDIEEFKKIWLHRDGHICLMVLGEIPELDYSMDENENSDINNAGDSIIEPSVKNKKYKAKKSNSKSKDNVNNINPIETMRNTMQYLQRKEIRNLKLNIQWEKQCLGIFSLQPAYPGRSSHVVTGNFLVNAGIRGKGIGKALVETFIEWSTTLGFTSCYFPLIYGTNVGMRRLLEDLNFRRIGVLPESGILKGFDVPIDSFIYGKEFNHITKGMDLFRDPAKSIEMAKYDRLKYYLEKGTYPSGCDRNEKARIRVIAKTHSLVNGKIMARDKEVVVDPVRQRQIALDIHSVNHSGINKVTSKIVTKYNWKGIKNTVTEVIAECAKCKLRYQNGMGVVVNQDDNHDNITQAHMLPNQTIEAQDLTKERKQVEQIEQSMKITQMANAVVGSLEQRNIDDNTTDDNNNNNIHTQNKHNNNFNGANHLFDGEILTPPDNIVTKHTPTTTDNNNKRRRYSAILERNGNNNNNNKIARVVVHSNNNNRDISTMTTPNDNDMIRTPNDEIHNSKNHNNNDNDNDRINMNILNKIVQESDISNSERNDSANNSANKNGTNKNGTNKNNNNIMKAALLDLEDNVMAALEMVQKDQEGNQMPLIFDFGEDYLEEEDEDYEEPLEHEGGDPRSGDGDDAEEEEEEDEDDDELELEREFEREYEEGSIERELQSLQSLGDDDIIFRNLANPSLS